jgi:hypothetical protein
MERVKCVQGEPITVKVRVTNRADFPVTLFVGGGTFDAPARIAIVREERAIRVALPSYQAIVSGPITLDEKVFKTLQPGESIDLHSMTFKECWDLQGKDPGLKESYTLAKKEPLPVGAYRAKVTYGFGYRSKQEMENARSAIKDPKKDPVQEQRTILVFQFMFTPKAEQLAAVAWQGSLDSDTEFVVTPR